MLRFEFIDHNDEASRYFESIELARRIHELINDWKERQKTTFKIGKKVYIWTHPGGVGIIKEIRESPYVPGLLVTMQNTGKDEEWEFDKVYRI